MNMLNAKQEEERLIFELKSLECDVDKIFKDITKLRKAIDEAKSQIADRNGQRAILFEELHVLHQHMNEELERGKDQIIQDLKDGKTHLVDSITGQPKVIALFAER